MPDTEDEAIWENQLYRIYDAAAKALIKSTTQRTDLLDVGSGFGGFLVRAQTDGWKLWGVLS